ncbi:guanylate kinase [Atribacter laminatus]|jgi:guanylate kinase|uniref:Guanylate kinase n=1 Tax=Atribacter laminatus TaxID=2847778 RepID=A0A7T1F1P7_ATRLM|nr:guanylate kinase [Atribacter laminatus]QPM66917.1 Guanylate kinase [Atribacter laminatus]
MSGLLFVLSGPSGAGKSTVRKAVMKQCKGLKYSISYTTRLRREGEREAIDYYFVDDDTFKHMKENHMFIEWAKVHGNFYGTPRLKMEEWLQSGFDVILEIDVQGAFQVKRNYPQGIFVFIAPPSLETLGERLRNRKTDREDVIYLRMMNALGEMKSIRDYDYLIINNILEETVHKFHSVIIAERCRIRYGDNENQEFLSE